MHSPFSEILKPYDGQLPGSFKDQYLTPSDAPFEIVLGGTMQRVWHRPKWLWPVFWMLSRADMFFPETGENIPTTLVVTPLENSSGEPIQLWERTFHFPNDVKRRYRSIMQYDQERRQLVELQGPNNAFVEIAEMRFTAPGTIEFLTIESRLRLGRFNVKLPRVLWTSGHVVQTIEERDHTRVKLTLNHGLLGPIFGYEGVFRTSRRPRQNAKSAA